MMYLYPSDDFDVELTDVRVHVVALTRWFNRQFLIREGMPVPVLLAGPMDAFAQFNRLWVGEHNPFSYLKELKEYPGREPAPLRFPLISVDWKGMRYRPEQSYASRVNRRLYWPTVNSPAQGLVLSDLANVAQARFPAAWTFSYQVDFWCARPDTQAIFVKQLTNCFKTMSASVPQTYIPVVYPGYFGARYERVVLTSSIDDMTEKEPEGQEIRYRTSVVMDIEGYAVDQNVMITPTVWSVVSGDVVGVSPASLNILFSAHGVS